MPPSPESTHPEFHDIALEVAKILFANRKDSKSELLPRPVAADLWRDYRLAFKALEYEAEAEKKRK